MPSGKYTTVQQAIKPRPWSVHPIWRGIGCVMLILMPIISFLVAYILIDEEVITDLGIPYPAEFSYTLFSFPFLGTEYRVDWMTLILTGAFILVSFAGIMILYSILYSALGPSRHGPLDAPMRYKRKKKFKQRR